MNPGKVNYAEAGCCWASQVFRFYELGPMEPIQLVCKYLYINAKMSTAQKTLQ